MNCGGFYRERERETRRIGAREGAGKGTVEEKVVRG